MTRTYGTGTMTEVRPGTWRLRVSVKDPISGRSFQRSKAVRTKTRASRKDLERELDAFKRDLEKKRATGKCATIGKLLDDWLEEIEREGRARSTLETYRSHVETKIRPALGDVPLADMTPDRVRAFMGSLKGAPRTQHLTHAVLRAALTLAVENDWLPYNPAARVKAPKVIRGTAAPLRRAQVDSLIEAAQGVSPAMGMAVLLAAITGARRGELVGLRWTDIDWKAQTIQIERAWVPGTGGQELGDTRTEDHRTVSMRGNGIEVLTRWKAAQEAGYGELGEWLLSDTGGTEPLRAKTVTETFTRLARDGGIHAHFHDLRHFASTQSQGVPTTRRHRAASDILPR
jgi:integrase